MGDTKFTPGEPKLEYWMLNTIHDALRKEYDRYKKSSGINSQLAMTAKRKGLEFAKECEREIQENKYHPLGNIWQTMKRIEEMRGSITDVILSRATDNTVKF